MILHIQQAGSEITYRGKIYRTPIKLHIRKSEVSKFTKMMKFKSIYAFDIIDTDTSENIIHNIVDANIDKNTSIKNDRQIDRSNISKIRPRTRVVNCTKVKEANNIIESDTLYHESIENINISDIDIDIDSDDILKQLLMNV